MIEQDQNISEPWGKSGASECVVCPWDDRYCVTHNSNWAWDGLTCDAMKPKETYWPKHWRSGQELYKPIDIHPVVDEPSSWEEAMLPEVPATVKFKIGFLT